MNPWLLVGQAMSRSPICTTKTTYRTILPTLFSHVLTFHLSLNPLTQTRQELQHARRRAEVAEAIATRCEASAKAAAAAAASAASSRSASASPAPEASPPAPRQPPAAPRQVLSAKGRPAPRRDSLRSSRQRLDGSQPEVRGQMCINFKMVFYDVL